MAKRKERPELNCVRSHQNDDLDVNITQLSVVTKLSIKVNALATRCLNRLDPNPRVPMDPSSEVLLHQLGQVITSDYKVSMQSNIQRLVMEEYY